MKKAKIKLLCVDLLILLALVAFDQYTKYLAATRLDEDNPIKLIPGVFELQYLENRGAAFGMLQNQKIFFIFVAIVILAVIFYVISRMPFKKKFKVLNFALVVTASGAIGNMIDRFRNDYVIDFFSFELIHFPIFNVADIYVTCAVILIVILLLFVYKEDDLRFLSFKNKNLKDVEKHNAQKAAKQNETKDKDSNA